VKKHSKKALVSSLTVITVSLLVLILFSCNKVFTKLFTCRQLRKPPQNS